MSQGALFFILAGLAFGGFGTYKFAIRSRSESVLEREYRKAWGDAQLPPNPHVLRNNRYLGFLSIILAIVLVAVGLTILLQQ